MANIGSWGTTVVFSTSDSRILTFKDFTRKVSSTWATHSRIGKKDQTEFLRPDLQKVTFIIELNALYGVRPRTIIDTIAKAVETGTVNTLVIGGKKVGSNQWKITDTSETWDVILDQGSLVEAKISVTMEEYL